MPIFGQKLCEWVKIVYFFSSVFFFQLLNLSEWVDFKLFLGFCFFFLNNTPPKFENNRKVPQKQHKVPFFWPFFADIWFFSSEWLANFSWEKIKNSLYFFFPKSGKKIQNSLKSSEWVGCKLFPGKKNTVPLAQDEAQITSTGSKSN